MGWSEESDFVIEGTAETIKNIKSVFTSEDGTIAYNDLMVRLGLLSQEQLESIREKSRKNLKPFEVLWNEYIKNNCLPTCTTIFNIDTDEETTMKFSMDCWKHYAAWHLRLILKDKYPDCEIYVSVLDELDLTCFDPTDCDPLSEDATIVFTNDSTGKHFPLFVLCQGEKETVEKDPDGNDIHCIRSENEHFFQTAQDAEEFRKNTYPDRNDCRIYRLRNLVYDDNDID